MTNVSPLPPLGQTLLSGADRTLSATGQAEKLEGFTKQFNDREVSSTPGAKTLRSQKKKVCMLVRNVSGVALDAKRIVKWKSGKRNKQVDGYCNASNEEVAGVVDEHLGSSGVPNNDLFWITVKGPTLILTPLEGNENNVISEGDILVALTAITSQATTAGRFKAFGGTFTATQTTDGTASNIHFNRIGKALSAKTTANTNADCLVDMALMMQE